MSDHAIFIKAICAVPDDDLPRVVYADWLDEHGEGERATFIRVQCELDGMDKAGVGRGKSLFKKRADGLRKLERHLWENHAGLWFPLPPGSNGWNLCLHGYKPTNILEGQPSAIVRRGFVDQVACTQAFWMSELCRRCVPGRRGRYVEQQGDNIGQYTRWVDCHHCNGTGFSISTTSGLGPAVVAAHPVTRVVLIDAVTRSPVPGSQFGGVTRESLGPLFDVAFPTSIGGPIEGNADQIDDLVSRAAIAWAKRKAGIL